MAFFRVGAAVQSSTILASFWLFLLHHRGRDTSPQLPLHRQETVSIETLASCFCAPSAAVKVILEWAHLEPAWTGDAARSRVKVIRGGALPWKQACSVTLLKHEALNDSSADYGLLNECEHSLNHRRSVAISWAALRGFYMMLLTWLQTESVAPPGGETIGFRHQTAFVLWNVADFRWTRKLKILKPNWSAI